MHAMAQGEPSGLTTDLATRSKRDGALDAALERLAPGRMPERPDTPDRHVTAVRRLPAVAARYAPFPEALDERLRRALASRGISQLYTHQAEAIDHALAGRHVVVITPTASGKTLCYNAPVLNAILQDPSSRALYLFPTKALAQDQLAELHALCEALDQADGLPAGAPDDFTVHVKNGWAPLPPVPGWFVNSIGCFTHGHRNYSVVVLTQGNPTMGYGVATVQDVAEVINHGLNPGARHVIARSRPFPSWGRPDEPAAG